MTQLSAGLRTIFESHTDEFSRRVETLERAVAAIADGRLDEDLRGCAERDAHKLAGSLGTFGLARGSELASELERRLAPRARAVVTDEGQMSDCVVALRGELNDEIGPPALDRRRETFESRLLTPATGTILVVDDDMPVRLALASILTDAGYEVLDVGSAREARHALEHDEIALLLSDVSMPGESGLDLIRFALCEHPETATLLISSLEDPGIAQVAMDFGAYGYLSKPVRRSAVLIGVMNALRRRDMEERERGARAQLERTVTQRTGALDRALERLEDAVVQGRVLQAETIHRWAQAAEHREPGIGKHIRRMSRYCGMLGGQLGLRADSLELTSVLHDVGKTGIPDSILLKRGPLSPDERLAIETHAEIGYEMLRDSCSSLLDLAAVIAWTHHEKFDGSGYPRGLAGTDIPLEGRVAAVADVFDALTCDRVYRAAWSVPEACEWMRSERGKHFDPHVLDTFLASMDHILAIRSDLMT